MKEIIPREAREVPPSFRYKPSRYRESISTKEGFRSLEATI